MIGLVVGLRAEAPAEDLSKKNVSDARVKLVVRAGDILSPWTRFRV